MNRHDLRADTDLEVGTVMGKGQILELHDGSFLLIMEFWKSKYGLSVNFIGHLFRPIKVIEDYPPVKCGGRELVWLCEAKEHESNPEGYLRSARSKDVLRIRQAVLTEFDRALESIPQSQATEMATDTESMVCPWKLVAELSDLHKRGRGRNFRSELSGSNEKPKDFMPLSRHEIIMEEPLPENILSFSNTPQSIPRQLA